MPHPGTTLLICHKPNFETGWQHLKGWCPKQLLKVLISIRFWQQSMQSCGPFSLPRIWKHRGMVAPVPRWSDYSQDLVTTITALTTMIKNPNPTCHCNPITSLPCICFFTLTLWLSHESNGKRIASSLDPLDCCQRLPQAGKTSHLSSTRANAKAKRGNEAVHSLGNCCFWQQAVQKRAK